MLTLVTGGARSGKSAFAERLAAQGRGPVIFVATASLDDAEMRARAERHQQRRPADWRTIEAPMGVAAALAGVSHVGAVLVDDLGLLVSNLLLNVTGGREPEPESEARLEGAIAEELKALSQVQQAADWDLIVVTNEVGGGIVPNNRLGRIFRDALGCANQWLAARADAVYLLVAGIPVKLKPSI